MGRRTLAAILLIALWNSLLIVALARPIAQDDGLAAAPEVASYNLDVTLDPAAKTVSGQGTITYRNPSADTLDEIWLRLYLKAFSSIDSLWMRESGGGMRGFDVSPDELGDITLSRLALRGGPDLLANSTINETLLQAPLPAPLGPGETLTLEVEWISKLPRVFARTGYGGRDDTFFMVGQWYPKLAVYDRGRWDNEPWHANAEFFHDFGNYSVSVAAPPDYLIAGVGVPDGAPEQRGGLQISRFRAESVTDFAFAASPDFQIHTRQANAAEVVLYLLPEHAGLAERYLDVAADSLDAYSAWFGAYPHPRLTVVDVPDNAAGAGGMEYPTLITGGTLGAPASSGFLEMVVAHEVAHQWWPMQTATNEAREPWLDEGLTEYSAARFLSSSDRNLNLGLSFSADSYDLGGYATAPAVPSDLPAWEYGGEYATAVYYKPAVSLISLERTVGSERMLAAMARYLREQRFRHPTGAEFRAAIEAELGPQPWFFDQLIPTGGQIDYAVAPIENGPAGSTVLIERQGAVAAPLEVRIGFASGRSEIRTWDGAEDELRLEFPAGDPVREVVLDPEYKLFAELDRRDNEVADGVQFLPLLAFAARLSYWAQTIVQTIGLFG